MRIPLQRSLPGSALVAACLLTGTALAGKVPPGGVAVHGPSLRVPSGPQKQNFHAVFALDEICLAEPAAGEKALAGGAKAREDFAAARAAAVAAAIGTPAMAIEEEAPGIAFVRLSAPAADAAALAQIARELAENRRKSTGGETKVYGVLYNGRGQRRSWSNRAVVLRQAALQVQPGADAAALAAGVNASIAEKVSYVPDTYLLNVGGNGLLDTIAAAQALSANPSVVTAEPQLGRRMALRAVPNDPLLPEQWHLINDGEVTSGSIRDVDLNIEPAWDIATGSGVLISVVDDGLQTSHPDLSPAARTDIDFDYTQNDADPSPANNSGDWHGTSCAGLAAGRGNNAIGIAGVAYQASLVGVRLYDPLASDSVTANALLHQVLAANAADRVSVITNSWGPADDGITLEAPGTLVRNAIVNAITNGRGGRGAVYCWAAGNGRDQNDNANYDGRGSSRYVIAVAACGDDGSPSWYSEPGFSILVNTPSSFDTGTTFAGITSTDVAGNGQGYDGASDYTGDFGGTSAASPQAAGVVALMLQANPNLTWRDVQAILALTAARNNPQESAWITNAAGFKYNPNYGFGRINAGRAVQTAQTWTTLPVQSATIAVNGNTGAVPDNNPTGFSSTFNVTAAADYVLETVEVVTNINHTWRGDLRITLTSPSGVVSVLAEPRGDNGENYANWTFLTRANFGENPQGTWTLRVVDTAQDDNGTVTSAQLRINGYVRGSYPVLTRPASTAPGAPGDLEPIMHVRLDQPAIDPDGTPVQYRYRWTSSGADVPVVHGPMYDMHDTLREGDGGATFTAGELWTVTVFSVDEETGADGSSITEGTFRVEADGTIRFEGWITN